MGKRDGEAAEDRKDIHQNIHSSHVWVAKGIVDNFYSLYNIIPLTLFDIAFQ